MLTRMIHGRGCVVTGYQGGWYQSKCHGHGMFCDKHGTVYEGQYYQSTGPGLP
jgi:hypothetical protein